MLLTRRHLIATMAASLVPILPASADTSILRGTVNYVERMALPANTVVIVQLADVSRADAPAEIIAEHRITGATGSPIPYRLSFDHAKIDLRHRYALQARILDGDRLLFITTKHRAIFAGGRNNTRLLVQRVAEHAPVGTSPAGKWLAEDILGGGVIDRLQTTLEIAPDGIVSGHGGCNRYRGRVSITGESISFSPLASTKMACTPAAMAQEQKFQQALERARSFRINARERKLILRDGAGATVARLARM
ncbi:META domain-containing protein [Nitrobacteraceae bacterium UC4446_H13]